MGDSATMLFRVEQARWARFRWAAKSTLARRYSLWHSIPIAFGFALVSLLATGNLHAQQNSPTQQQSSAPLPTLEGLPHSTLPRGEFKAWCGKKDR